MGPLIPLFWTSGDVSSGFQSQSGQPYSCLVEAYVLHIPWDSPVVLHLPTSWLPVWASYTFSFTKENYFSEITFRWLFSCAFKYDVISVTSLHAQLSWPASFVKHWRGFCFRFDRFFMCYTLTHKYYFSATSVSSAVTLIYRLVYAIINF